MCFTIYELKIMTISKSPFFSIVIPTLNEEKYLPLLLKDLASQTFDDFEVIHVDGNSEDQTVKLADQFADRLTLKIKVVTKRNVAHQRNSGAKLAKGEWVIFMDADNRLDKNFLKTIKKQLKQNPETDVFTCLVKVENNKDLLKKATQKGINYGLELYHLLGRVSAFGALIGCRTKLLKTYQFDEKQKIYEDTIFVQNLVNQGYSFSLFKKPVYYYSLRRMNKEGTLKFFKIAAQMNLRYLQGKDFSNKDFGYVMKGGKYYDQVKSFSFKKLSKLLEEASEKQRQRARKILQNLRELQF